MKESEKIKFIQEEVLTAAEAGELLGVTRQRLSTLVTSGKLKPVKKVGTVALFLLGHVQALKKELEAGRKKYRYRMMNEALILISLLDIDFLHKQVILE
nr:DNA-binding protein [Bacillus subtilis]